ncbi:hypothetical protein D3C73_1538590 [compost metagenome]
MELNHHIIPGENAILNPPITDIIGSFLLNIIAISIESTINNKVFIPKYQENP